MMNENNDVDASKNSVEMREHKISLSPLGSAISWLLKLILVAKGMISV
jgi:hypothetical protein